MQAGTPSTADLLRAAQPGSTAQLHMELYGTQSRPLPHGHCPVRPAAWCAVSQINNTGFHPATQPGRCSCRQCLQMRSLLPVRSTGSALISLSPRAMPRHPAKGNTAHWRRTCATHLALAEMNGIDLGLIRSTPSSSSDQMAAPLAADDMSWDSPTTDARPASARISA